MSIQISSDSHQRGRRYNRLELKLSLCFAAMAVFISALLTFGLYQITVDWLRQSLKQRIRDAVAIGASQLDGDAFAALTDPAQENSPAYQKLQNELRRIRDAGQDFRFVYTVRKEADGKIIFVVDAEESPEDVSHLGDHYDDAGPALESRIGKKNDVFVEDDFYTDKWGSWLTGYAPVRGADGEQKVLLCADIAASTVLQKESKLFWSAVAAFGVTLPLSLFVGALLGRQHAKPIMALTRGAELITGGDLDHVVEASGKDEVGDLAKAFNTMTRKLSRSMEALQKSEKELIQHRDHLEVLVGERTASLEAANRRMNKDLASAAQVQQTFLPQKPPEVPGVRFAWNFTPCEKLAGDMLDISWVDSRHVGIWVADVCGHGVAAALVSVILSRLLSSLHQSDNSMLAQADGAEGNGTIAPSDIAEFLNERFSCDPETMRYFTFLYGLLDVKTREFRYVSAGHPGPLLVPVEGEARILPMSPPAIGILPSPHFIEHRVTLEAGSRLYLYTDGVTETSDKHEEEFGENQLSRIMMEYRSLSLQESVDALLLDLAKWRDGANPADDISLVAVELE